MGGFANNAPIVTDGLVFYVDAGNDNSYPGSGTTWTDLINGFGGTLTNGSSYIANNGGFIDFDGSNDYVTTNYSSLFSDINGGMSINFWIKTTATARQSVLGAFNDGFTTGGRVYLNSDNNGQSDTSSGKIAWWCRDNSNDKLTFTSDSNVRDGSWHNVAITISGTSSSDVKVYQDSVSKTVSIGTSDFDKTNVSALTHYVWLGAENNRGSVNQPFDGSLACVSFYSKVLSASEVLQNYNALKNRFA